MRILIATTYPTVVGGVETYLRNLLPALIARGHEVAVVHEAVAEPGRASISDHTPDVPRWLLGSLDTQRNLEAWNPDVCYSQGLTSPRAEAALLDRFQCVLFAHNYHGTCVSGTKRHAWPNARPCDRQRGLACLLHYYPRRCGGLSPVTLLHQHHLQSQHGSLLPRYRAVLVASRHMQTEFLRHGVPKRRISLVPLFPSAETPDAEAPVERAPTGRVLLAGRLTDLKGGDFLVEAVRQASDKLSRPLTLVVAGEGQERPALEALARRIGVVAEFHGWVDPDRCRDLMRGCDLLAVPSVWPEPFGLVGIEAGCVGLPAVGYAVGGVPDWLLPGVSGELAPGQPPTAIGLAEAIVRALATPERTARLRRGAWSVAQRYSLESHMAKLERVFAVAGSMAQFGAAVE